MPMPVKLPTRLDPPENREDAESWDCPVEICQARKVEPWWPVEPKARVILGEWR